MSQKPPHYFPLWLHHFTFPPAKHKDSTVSRSSSALVFCMALFCFHSSHTNRCELICHYDLYFYCYFLKSSPEGEGERGRGREGERDWLLLPIHSRTRMNLATFFWCMRGSSNQLSHPARASIETLRKKILFLFIFIEGEGREKERERNIAVQEKR